MTQVIHKDAGDWGPPVTLPRENFRKDHEMCDCPICADIIASMPAWTCPDTDELCDRQCVFFCVRASFRSIVTLENLDG